MGEVVAVAGVPLVGRDGRLIRPGADDGAHQVAQIEIVRHEILLERVQQRRIRRRIGRANVIHRIDDALAREIAPHPVGDRFRKERVVPGGEPCRQGVATLRAVRNSGGSRTGQELRLHHPPVLGVLHLVIGALIEHNLLAHFIAGADAHRREERRHLVVLILRPALERMIVALRAHHADAEEYLRGLLHRRLGLAGDAEIIRRWIVVRAAARGQQLAHQLVVGPVRCNRLVNPLLKFVGALLTEILAAGLEQIAPLHRPVIDVFRAGNQPVDRLHASQTRRRGIVQEGTDTLR